MLARTALSSRALSHRAAPPLCPSTGLPRPCLQLLLCSVSRRETNYNNNHNGDIDHYNSANLQLRLKHTNTKQPRPEHYKSAQQPSRPGPPPTKQHRDKDDGRTKLAARINPPTSTLPAPLELPKREKGQNAVVWAYRCGKQYWGFYKTGVKNIFANRRLVKALRLRLAQERKRRSLGGAEANDGKGQAGKGQAGREVRNAEMLTRGEWQLLRRSRQEWMRVPVFGLLLCLLGEWLPLVIVFMTPVVPYNCRIPRQIEKSRRKFEMRSWEGKLDRKVVRERFGLGDQKESRHGELEAGKEENESQKQLRDLKLRAFSCLPAGFTTVNRLGLTALALSRVERQTAYLSLDTALLLRETKDTEKISEALSEGEVKIAAEQRGIFVLGRDVEDIREDLEDWLSMIQSVKKETEGNWVEAVLAGRGDGKVKETLVKRICGSAVTKHDD